LRQLAKIGQVELGFLTEEVLPSRTIIELGQLCGRVAFASVGGWKRWVRAAWFQFIGRSATEGLFYSPSLRRTIDGWLQESAYDAIVTFSSSVLQYVLGRGFEERLIVDLVDVDSQKWLDYAQLARRPLAWLFRREAQKVRQIERRASPAKAVVLISEAEADLYRRIAPDANVVIATNGVDLEYFRPQVVEERPTCVFVGSLDYRANVIGVQWFCREVWPQVHARFPEGRFQIVGRNPTPGVQSLAHLPGVEVVGEVEDVRTYLAPARLVVVPLLVARGIQNKVLEAMSQGKPVIASPGALEGISIAQGRHALQADSPSEWIEMVADLWFDQKRRADIGRAARRFVEEHHHWPDCLRPLADAALSIVSEAARGREVPLAMRTLQSTRQ
jgi:sugar transferase (PEP-CTERM/EpsH1 system associated)